MDPNNIAIHVGQNFVNFAAGTLAWFILSFFFEERTRKRSFPESPIPITIKAPPPVREFNTELFSKYFGDNEDEILIDTASSRTQRVSRSTNDPTSTRMSQITAGKQLANVLRSFADTAESFDRYFDEQ
jgi:hypothetical protein